jgi:hypothetical protein
MKEWGMTGVHRDAKGGRAVYFGWDAGFLERSWSVTVSHDGETGPVWSVLPDFV